MTSPFLLPTPAMISFSGGRTSGFMLAQILEAHGGRLPEGCHVVFANTGREMPETLTFVHEVSLRWGVPIRWLEWRPTPQGEEREAWLAQRKEAALAKRWPSEAGKRLVDANWAEVDHASAAREGEPFGGMITERQYLPNPTQRLCTLYLKVLPMHAFAAFHLGLEEWTSAVGIRYDERRRWKMLDPDERSPWENKTGPLIPARITKADVMAFWKRQPFDLGLEPHESNCDGCFMKGWRIRDHIFRDHPERLQWWVDQEEKIGARFRPTGPSYAQLQERIRRLPLLPGIEQALPEGDDDDSLVECNCHD